MTAKTEKELREEIANDILKEFDEWCSLSSPKIIEFPLNSPQWFVKNVYLSSARIAREGRPAE